MAKILSDKAAGGKKQRETQREQSEGRMDQVAVVVRPENVPGGKSRIYVLSTANLSESAIVSEVLASK